MLHTRSPGRGPFRRCNLECRFLPQQSKTSRRITNPNDGVAHTSGKTRAPMTSDQQIREKLKKIKALFSGASSEGERQAAQAAMDRLHERIRAAEAEKQTEDPPVEFRFSLRNPWSLRLFLALCRAKGYRPYRHPRMRRTSVCVRIGARRVHTDLWPEYLEMDRVLTEHLGELADQIIADCINPDKSDAETIQGLPAQDRTGTEMEG